MLRGSNGVSGAAWNGPDVGGEPGDELGSVGESGDESIVMREFWEEAPALIGAWPSPTAVVDGDFCNGAGPNKGQSDAASIKYIW